MTKNIFFWYFYFIFSDVPATWSMKNASLNNNMEITTIYHLCQHPIFPAKIFNNYGKHLAFIVLGIIPRNVAFIIKVWLNTYLSFYSSLSLFLPCFLSLAPFQISISTYSFNRLFSNPQLLNRSISICFLSTLCLYIS